MRITGGFLKGRVLSYREKSECRPTQSKVREAIFNILATDIEGKNVADFFAGTGALGFEALSRGAVSVTFVDNSADAIKMLKRNAEILGVEKSVRIIKMETTMAIKKLRRESVKFDLIFADPPYKTSMEKIKSIFFDIEMIMNDNGIFLLETDKNYDDIDITGLEIKKEKTYGSTRIWIYQAKRTGCCVSWKF
ncbi:MAG TPA: 16S rRNA (guanine(966)-N(2))-methyltransferase RsmD [Candidatus Ratteibacteria bacterium]|jgi:16S rRNA (guanine(966)-N(2))-methyltransferase RsmD|uniref:Ribosomal RNA small subunit methyltransferase D n=1 Tax=candidate division TA06 bacterium ADurb.Bin131 TaxID=1852827 RepID=A0A1V6C4I5_UNCT6|nr:MAG: Ribosomal RNA small subunit methyltransferase D [candidate division TA06 bacterium ADurb.Bin131]HOC02664.1 16S rRNA (guanine(966)-N(2))-methyltransferase RsmD [bacterium]HRS06247.1 16S rRNA (guanine(966)-N(2))-methyltransferase RsmD [Candidatus Ratteibacteria bacterium]HON04904.1 16S rRNA (guanine(966)-N(2))-methyltransferase RsmD [bacterium]HPC29966.1 16S rRNA (guanine(966)-N(2))-methyltransferase RsmD [bacterium]